MNWREKLGGQIRTARLRAGLTQQELAENTYVKREHISNIELGKNSPAVKIITDIARALNEKFEIEGCIIDPFAGDTPAEKPVLIGQQLILPFGVEHCFSATSITFTSGANETIELRATFSSGAQRA